MIKKILKIVKSVIFAAFLLYGYNLIAAPLNLVIPINVITVGIIAFLGLPALFGMVILLIVAF